MCPANQRAGSHRPLVVFFVVAYAWAWLVDVPLVILHGRLPWVILATLGPTIAAVVAICCA
jgi:hypothetical protein